MAGNRHPTPVLRSWLGDGGPLRGRRGVAEVGLGHVCKPVVTDDGDVAVEKDAVTVDNMMDSAGLVVQACPG